MKKELLIKKRKKARELKEKNWGVRKISRYLMCSKDSVRRWLEMDESEVQRDDRGWKKGRLRRYSDVEKRRIMRIRAELEERNTHPFGEKFIRKAYKEKYGDDISEWFINRTLREYKELKSDKKVNRVDVEKMKLIHVLLKKLGRVIVSVDFNATNYTSGLNGSLHLLSCKYIAPIKFGILSQISKFSTTEVIRILKSIWCRYLIPDVIRLSNHTAFGANAANAGCIGDLTLFVLNLGIIPLYMVPKRMWNVDDSENYESIFSENFMSSLRFVNGPEESVELNNFHLEFKRKRDCISGKMKNNNPFFLSAFTDEELKNRQVDSFMGKKIFFYVSWKEDEKRVAGEKPA